MQSIDLCRVRSPGRLYSDRHDFLHGQMNIGEHVLGGVAALRYVVHAERLHVRRLIAGRGRSLGELAAESADIVVLDRGS